MMADEQRTARTIRCPDPSAAVVKQLFGTAMKCGRPTCKEALYRIESDQPALNCRMAHIRASSPKGPRSDPLMTCTEVNAFENLLLLCPFDASLIDDRWEDFPVDLLADWKRQQIDQASLLGTARPPTNDEISQLIVDSRQHGTVVHVVSVDLAKSARRLRSQAERTRKEPQLILLEQQQAERQLNQGFIGFNTETGERTKMQLSRSERRWFTARIADALRETSGPVEVAADSVLADSAGVAVSVGKAAADARSWVERSVAEVVELAGEWNDQLDGSLDRLDEAVTALIDAAAGRTAQVPPPPESPLPPQPSPWVLFIERCREIHESAARHESVDHLPFDAELRAQLLDLAPDCAAMPTVVSLMPLGSGRNAALAAATLKNANDEQFAQALDAAAALQPEAAAAQHLLQLHFLASERDWSKRLGLVQAKRDGLSTTIIKRSASSEFWVRNAEHGSFILQFAVVVLGVEEVTGALRRALADVALLEPILIALSETAENRDSTTFEFLNISRSYGKPGVPSGDLLPSFVPIDGVCAAIAQRWPTGPNASRTEVERLAAEFTVHRCSA